MKRNALLTSVILLLCLALLCGCQKKTTMVVGELSVTEVRNDVGISLTVDLETLSPSGSVFTLTNNSADPYSFHDGYSLEMWTDDGWHTLVAGGEVISDLLLYTLPMYESRPITHGWSQAYGELPVGEYRILKQLIPHEGFSIQDSFYVSCEFTIE